MTYTYQFPRPSVTVDSVILRTPSLNYPEVMLIKRKNEPFKDHWAIPGGFMDLNEDPLTAASRELMEETNLKELPLKPLFSCAQLNRDPRGRTVTLLFGCLIRDTEMRPNAGDDAKEAKWFPLKELPKLAFDHNLLLKEVSEHIHWQAKTTLVGRDVFHNVASVKDIKRLHKNICPEIEEDFLDRAQKLSIIKINEGLCEYNCPPPGGPDWNKIVW